MMYDDVFAKRVTGESAAGADLEHQFYDALWNNSQYFTFKQTDTKKLYSDRIYPSIFGNPQFRCGQMDFRKKMDQIHKVNVR